MHASVDDGYQFKFRKNRTGCSFMCIRFMLVWTDLKREQRGELEGKRQLREEEEGKRRVRGGQGG